MQPQPVRPAAVRTRQIFHIGGFEAVAPDKLGQQLDGGLKRFGLLWGVRSQRSDAALSGDGRSMEWRVATEGGNWATECRYTVLRWDALIRSYMQGPWLRRTFAGYAALSDFLWTFTIWRYYGRAFRYGNFAIFPFFALWALANIAVFLGRWIGGVDKPLAYFIAPSAGVLAFLLLARLVGSSLHLDFSLSHWRFARDLARRRIPNLNIELDRFAAEIVAAVKAAEVDEIIISATGLGSAMAVEAFARALLFDADLCRRGPQLALLTTGSSLLQIGLHPAARDHRAAVARVAAEPDLYWLEVQAGADAVNFYKSDPVTGMGLSPAPRPTVQVIHIRDMLKPEEYRWVRLSQLRLHARYVMPNGVRYFYDYYMICFGPLSLPELATLGDATVKAFSSDGSLVGTRPPRPTGSRPAAA